MKTNIAFAVILMLCSAVANAAIHNVPGEYSTIQDAINVSVDGDVVLVADGVYTGTGNRDIHFEGKDIRVESVNGPETCIIDCQGTVSQPHTGFIFDDGEGSGAGLVGLTIRNGYAAPGTVTNGGAINCFGSNPSLINCIFHNNSADNGGAIYLLDTPSPMLLFNCLFFDNTAASDGGAISANITSQIMIYSCTFAGNSAGSGGALDSWHANLSIRNSIIWDNTPDAIHHLGSDEPQVVYSNIQGGYVGDGNLDVEPVFTSSGSADYFLSQTPSGQTGTSPCVDAGSGQSSLVCFQRWNLYYCLDEATTRTDGVYDLNLVDMGFHYGFFTGI